MMLRVYVDACMEPEKLVSVFTEDKGAFTQPHDGETHNQGEYLAILEAMESYFLQSIEVCSDSQLAVSQINSALGLGKLYKCNNSALQELLKKVIKKVAWRRGLGQTIEFIWVPREENPAGWVLERLK